VERRKSKEAYCDRSLVLPAKRALQSHPESGKLFQRHIDMILAYPELIFHAAVLDRCLYRTEYEGETVLFLQQVDDFALSCISDTITDEIFGIIRKQLQLPDEYKPPFEVFGLLQDLNGALLESRATTPRLHQNSLFQLH